MNRPKRDIKAPKRLIEDDSDDESTEDDSDDESE